MSSHQRRLRLSVVGAGIVCLAWGACDGTTTVKRDASLALGGAGGGHGGAAGAAGTVPDAAAGTGGGVGGSGGTTAVDAPMGTGGTTRLTAGAGGAHRDGGAPGAGGAFLDGGRTGTGGAFLDGGPLGAGGATGSGGATSSGGGTGAGGSTGADGATGIDAGPRTLCNAEPANNCPTGQFCDYPDHCGMVTDGPGVCVPTGASVGCDLVYQPVCGCDGRTYGNDCERGRARVQKYSDGECAADRDAAAGTDPSAGVAWQAAAVGATTGPGIMVMGRGWYTASTSTGWGRPSSILFDGTPSYSLSNAQLDDLFARLAAIDFSALPHAIPGTTDCKAKLIVGTCLGCDRIELDYSSAAQLAPELEPVWAWFDEVLGSPTAPTHPRTYCAN